MSTILEALRELKNQNSLIETKVNKKTPIKKQIKESNVGNRLRKALIEMKINEKHLILEKNKQRINNLDENLNEAKGNNWAQYYAQDYILKKKIIWKNASNNDKNFNLDKMKEVGLYNKHTDSVVLPVGTKLEYQYDDSNILVYSLPEYEDVEIRLDSDYLHTEFFDYASIVSDYEKLKEIVSDEFEFAFQELGDAEISEYVSYFEDALSEASFTYDTNTSVKDLEKIIAKYLNAYLENENLNEDVASSMPVTILPHDDVYNYIENVPEAEYGRPPYFFSVGYIREFGPEISSEFRGGRGSAGNPKVRIFKCSEMTVYTGADYENLKATRDYRQKSGKERSGERTGFNFDGETTIVNKIGLSRSGQEQLQCYMKKGTKPKVKYFISLDDENLREASKEEVAKYLTTRNKNKLLGNTSEPEEVQPISGADIMRLNLSQIYKIGNLGRSVIR